MLTRPAALQMLEMLTVGPGSEAQAAILNDFERFLGDLADIRAVLA